MLRKFLNKYGGLHKLDILKKFVDIYLNEDGGKINKILNDCKSLIFLVITLFLIDSFLSADTDSLNLIFDNKNFVNKSIEIFSFGSHLFFSLCFLSFLVFIICFAMFFLTNKFKKNKFKSQNISSYIFGASLRLVSGLEYLLIFLFIGYLFDREFLSNFINSYHRLPPHWFKFCLHGIFLILFLFSIFKRILSFFFFSVEKNGGEKTVDDEFDYTK